MIFFDFSSFTMNKMIKFKKNQKIYTLIQTYRSRPMKITYLGFIFVILMVMGQSYDQVDDYNHIMAYYQTHSYKPIMHVYYNRHFSKSKQFQNFVDVVQEAEYEIGSFSKIIFTDCETQESDKNQACRQIKRLNENRMIIGYQPSSQFTSFGDKIMQSPPKNKMFDHYSDSYTADQIARFIRQMMPSFFKQISNTAQFEEFKKPKYAPKLIYATKQGQVAHVVKQLGVQFFLRFDMAYVEDLTQSVINQIEIKKFPSLIVLKHNYETDKLQIFNYESNDFSQNERSKIKRFLDQHALREKRNDYVFHLIKTPDNAEIQTVDKSSDLEQALDKTQSWIFIEQGPSFSTLVDLKSKYGLFYEYIHFLKPELAQNRVFLLNHRLNVRYEYQEGNILYKTMNADDFQTNSTIWLRKEYVVVGVRQEYGYLCTIADKALFAGLVQCFIIEEASYETVSKIMGNPFQYGFVVSSKSGTTKIQGSELKSRDFESVYRSIQYVTRMKVRDIIDDFVKSPVKNITSTTSIQQLCAEPFKKCILYFSEKSADKTKRQYLELQAAHFVNEYKIYSVDLSCNSHIYEQIPLSEQSGGLIAYHPRINKYVFLKAKMTRNVIQKFLKMNNQDKKALPFRQFSTGKTSLFNCETQTHDQQSEPESNFQKEL